MTTLDRNKVPLSKNNGDYNKLLFPALSDVFPNEKILLHHKSEFSLEKNSIRA